MICASGALQDGGDGVRFTVRRGEVDLPAFVVRHGGGCMHTSTAAPMCPSSWTGCPGDFSILPAIF
jgi:hypothetical protein